MECKCGNRMYATDTRAVLAGRATRRRYECPKCGVRISTIEREVSDMRQETDRLRRGIERGAALKAELAEAIASAIESVLATHENSLDG